MNLYQSTAFLKHKATSKSRQGVHSPFVYKLVEEVFYLKGKFYNYDKVNGLRSRLLRDSTVIEVKDLGAGSKILGNKRSIKQIARVSVKNKKLGELIYRLAVHFHPEISIELGTSLGVTTSYLALANTKGQVYTIEGDPATRKKAIEGFQSLDLKNIHSIEGNFDEILPSLLEELPFVNLAFLDGNHRKDATLRYVDLLFPKMKNGSWMIIDDIYWSREMTAAWEEIVKNPAFTVTIDLFYFGLVFIREEQRKEHFKIRI